METVFHDKVDSIAKIKGSSKCLIEAVDLPVNERMERQAGSCPYGFWLEGNEDKESRRSMKLLAGAMYRYAPDLIV